MPYEAGTSSPAASPSFHVRSATIAAHRGQLEIGRTVQKRPPLAERMGFEPTIGFPLYALSRGGIRFDKSSRNRDKALNRASIPHLSPVLRYSQVPGGAL